MDHLRILGIEMEQQWSTKVVETLLENDAFRYLSICSILFASSVNSLIPLAPCCGLCCLRNRKKSKLFGREGGEMFPRRSKIEFYCQVSQHCCRSL